jgi:hypothetical protein
MSSKHIDYSLPSEREREYMQLVSGIQNSFPQNETIKVDGIVYTQSQFLAEAQGYLTPEVACRQGHLALEKLVAAKNANASPADLFFENSKKALVAFVGSANVDTLATYGIKPPKKRTKSTGPEAVVRTAKSDETREARDTMGSREKSEIKGSNPGNVTVTEQGKVEPSSQTPAGSVPKTN